MGNSESHYSVQCSRSNSCIIPGRQKPYSLKGHSAKEDNLSPLGFWNAGSGYSGLKPTNIGHSSSPSKSNRTFMSRQYDYITHKLKSGANSQWNGVSEDLLSGGCLTLPSENGCLYGSHKEKRNPNYGINTMKTLEKSPRLAEIEDQSSPRVVIKKDGSVRVEFNNSSNSSIILDDCTGPVQLLKFSPTLDSNSCLSGVTPSLEAHFGAPRPVASFKSSKGSSLSSDGSLYDLPWGTSVEVNDSDNGSPNSQRQRFSRKGGCLAEQLPAITTADLYRDPRIAATFPTVKDLQFSNDSLLKHRSSFVSVMEELWSEVGPEEKEYSSFTLPSRKPKHFLDNNGKKVSIRNRFRRISDWTGSLTKKKRKFQEPGYSDPVDCFDSGVDGLTADTSSPSQVSSFLTVPNGIPQARSHSLSLNTRSGSAGALHLGTDVLRQNIYKNFMRELKTGRPPAEGGREDWRESSSEETECSSQEVLGCLEQLDLLFDKEKGVVRRAGWLSFKPLLTVHKDRKLELVGRRKWKQFWVTLKGCTMLFYETYGKASSEPESPCYALIAEDGVVQAVPEHPKKENVFCLSNTYGDVYLFQASNQTDLENWVTAIHSASASLFAKRYGKEDTLRLLQGQIHGLLQKIDMDSKMRKMAELQLSIVGDPKNRKAIENQIQQWEQNLERFNMDLFRMRCYLASLQGGELPNPKSLLATASRPTKAALARLGIFSVSSFHALICSRDEATMRKRSLSLSHRGRSKKGLFSSLKGLDTLTKRGHEKKPSVSQDFSDLSCCSYSVLPQDGEGHLNTIPPCSFERLGSLANVYSVVPPEGSQWDCSQENTTCIYMPNYQTVSVLLKPHHTVTDVLAETCRLMGLDPSLHFLRLRRCVGDRMEVSTPSADELLQDMSYDDLEVSQLNVYTLHMSRPSVTEDYGFAVTGYVDKLKNSRIVVTEVLPDGLAFSKGLRPGDEIMVLNGCEVSSLDLALIQTLFNDQSLQLTVKHHPPSSQHSTDTANTRSLHRVNLQNHQRAKSSTDVSCVAENLGLAIDDGFQNPHRKHRTVQHSKSVDTVCSLYHSFQEGSGGLMEVQEQTGPEAATLRPCPRHMSATERLCKVIQELVDTEKSYVKDLNCLFEIYLKPLQKETFLSQDEMESLFGSLPEMLDFQKVFLQTLEEKISSFPNFNTLETPVQFKKLLFSLGGSFLYYAEHFKLYSGFCANHIKVQKVLKRAKTDRSFKEFLDARNPTKQHSTTLESYLIKPVQRVLKYPLLLRELVSLTDTDSEEHYHLTEALKEMEKVASHINEMQKIYEDYGAVFDQLVAEQSGAEKEVTEISMGQFLIHSSVIWLNPFPSLGRMKKDPELNVFVFKRAVILLYRENNKVRKKTPSSKSSHGEQDPFKFRWLIPLSALQVRLGNTADTDCLWELIHTKSQKAGRPETLFQLCSSTPECKVNTIKVIRSILRENLRRNMQRVEQLPERTCKKRLTPLQKTLPSSAKLGSSRPFLLSKLPSNSSSAPNNDRLRRSPDSDSASVSSGTTSSASAHLDQPSRPQQRGLRESNIISDEDSEPNDQQWQDCPSAIEAQFCRLRLTDEASQAPAPHVLPESGEVDTPERRAHFSAVKRKSGRGTSSLRRSRPALLNMRRHSHSLDSQTETMANSMDLNSLLEKDFSVQSLTSVVNEDFFYDNTTQAKNVTTS
ncbi:rho guanine nucleotide exchange factor TIAM2 isoform X1 [Carassius gibelio]|uniref:rho guanine nucleotide exchange factor TIAM2 isoform X1 n=1 Tax=Carassius gibelio TaxID=101364 RepID=UPI0022793391|nr:rho guanine nucleotide exchange factor TIAM2 isoform X1 [Carassius gibelio]XP_052435795.1 rho guanine nucleotide exchange factor TIAM2 isoform X1 [Carassius gibelio]XP_052435796.1 rho guanine nucleotide exchange factor TIAM2 isoform X1 [Carassius gibelio]